MDLAQMKAAVTMEGVLFGTAALELIAEVERLGGIVTALEEGCHKCQHPVRVRELTCQKKALQQVVAERDAEISRLTALCDGYRGEVDALLKEAESTLAFYAEKGRVTVSRDGNAVQRMGASAEIAILKAESALTRARAEGMKEAIKSADDVPATVSVYPTFEQARGAASAKEQIIAAIRERATKGDSDEG